MIIRSSQTEVTREQAGFFDQSIGPETQVGRSIAVLVAIDLLVLRRRFLVSNEIHGLATPMMPTANRAPALPAG